MQLVLELLKKIFLALQGVYTKEESDTALAELDVELESARRREQWKSQCYAEFLFKNTSTTTTQYDLFDITANGVWYVDYGDGNGAQLQTELTGTPVLDFGTDTERLVRFYGAITRIAKASTRKGDSTLRVGDCIIDSEGLLTTSSLVKYITSADTNISVNAPNANVDIGSRDASGYVGMRIVSLTANANYAALACHADSVNIVQRGAELRYSGIGIISPTKYSFKSSSTSLSVQASNLAIADVFTIDSDVVSTTTDFRFVYSIQPTADIKIRLPKLSNAPNFFSGYSANRFSLTQMLPTLESLPMWTDGATHNFGIHCYYTDSTETFSVTDSDGTTYSLENCPTFDEDDEAQTFRKAYVLTVAKKGWTILLKNKNA